MDAGLTILNGRPPSGLMFYLGLDHGRDAQSVKGPKPPHFFWTRTSVRLFFMMGHCPGYCFWGLGHGHDTRSVKGAKAPLILLEKKKIGARTPVQLFPTTGCRQGYCFLFGFGARTERSVRQWRLTSPHPARANFSGARRPVFDYSMTGRRQGYCLLSSGHGHDAWSINGSKAHFILLGHLFWGTDASSTILNNGPP
jgi:hypothetical protein